MSDSQQELNNQQKEEKKIIRPLLRFLNIDEKHVISSDRPDIITPDYNGKCIGIEIVECHPSQIISGGRNSNALANSHIQKLCNAYKEKLIEQGGNKILYITLFPHIRKIFEKKHYDPAVKRKIIEEIDRHLENDKIYRDRTEQNKDKWFQMYSNGEFKYEHVKVASLHELSSGQTIVTEIFADSVNTIDNEFLQKCISDKETKLKSYVRIKENENIKEYWLCIYLPPDEFMDFERKTDFPDFPFEDKPYESQDAREPRYAKIFLTQYDDALQIK